MLGAMKLSELTSSQLGELSRLIAQREKVEAQLRQIEDKLERFGGGAVAAVRRGRPAKGAKPAKAAGRRGPRKGSKPGRLKETLLAALHGAGAAGASVQDLSKKLKIKPNNLYSWFYTTGKKVAGLKRIASGNYVYSADKKEAKESK
jgi:hypothetical protein